MSIDILLTFATITAVLLMLMATRLPPDTILMGAATFLMVSGILTPQEAMSGFANTGVATIAVLYIIAAALKDTGAIQYIAHLLLGKPKHLYSAQIRMLVPTSILSAFLNNTAVVAMLIPAVQDWAQRIGISPSKLLMPLSYAAIMGGTLTLIGTSTNIVVDGLLQENLNISLGIFEPTWLGLPVVIVGVIYLLTFSGRILGERESVIEQYDHVREYLVKVDIPANSHLVSKSIADAGLTALNSAYLNEIERDDASIREFYPDLRLQAGDILYFIADPEGANELRNMKGLQPSHSDVAKLDIAHHQRHLVEVVIGPDFPALGQSPIQSKFRTRYKAVILAASRRGMRLPSKLDSMIFRVGDTLLLEAGRNFVDQYRFRRDFLLVSLLNDSTPPDFKKAPLALGFLGALVLCNATGLVSILEAALLAVAGMILTRCISPIRARNAINVSIIIVIAASFALGMAMTKTGAADLLAQWILGQQAEMSPLMALAIVYGLTVMFTEMITNNAAAVLMFPVALAVAEQLGVSFIPFAIAIMFAASASFITPIGYQTNLMVYGPGGYHFRDYLKLGIPLSIIIAGMALLLIPIIWPFYPL